MRKRIKWTHELFETEVKERTNDEYKVLGKYVKSQDKIQMEHKVCNYVWEVQPCHFLNGSRCPKCKGLVKKTTEQFKEEMHKLEGCKYELLSEYVNNHSKVKIKHNECGTIYEVTPSRFLGSSGKKGNRCPECYSSKKKNNDIFKSEIFELVGDEYEILGEYVNNKTKLKIKHILCAHIYDVKPNQFLRGSRCPKCSNHISKTYEEVKNFIEVESNSGCVLLSERYSKVNELLKIKCGCGELFSTSFNNFKIRNKRQCNNCSQINKSNKQRFSQDEFVKKVNDVSDNYEVLGEYISNHSKIKMKHISCGFIYEVAPSAFLGTKNRDGNRCPKCSGYMKKNTEQFKDEVSELTSDYTVLGEYTRTDAKIKMIHDACGCIFEVRPSNFLNGTRCPNCNNFTSKCIASMENYMKELDVSYLKEYSFPDCKSKRKLPFDFLISNKVLIEFDGGQHFKVVNYYGGEKGFKKRINNDKTKNQYCIENDIPLIRIPYWEKNNLEYILENVLSYFDIHKLNNKIDTELVKRYLVDSHWNHDTYLSWQHKENRYWLNNQKHHTS